MREKSMNNFNDSAGNSVNEALSNNLPEARFEVLHNAAVDMDKNRIVDALGCLIGGANPPRNTALLNLVKSGRGKRGPPSLFITARG